MFYTLPIGGAVSAADLPNSSVMLNPQFRGAPGPIDIFVALAAGGRMERRSQSGSGRDKREKQRRARG